MSYGFLGISIFRRIDGHHKAARNSSSCLWTADMPGGQAARRQLALRAPRVFDDLHECFGGERLLQTDIEKPENVAAITLAS
jgi:hypothetical protein